MIVIVAALTQEKVIGKNGKLPWNIPEEYQMFQDLIKNGVAIMGRKTYEAIPRPMAVRPRIVVSQSKTHIPGVTVCPNVSAALEKAKAFQKPIYIVGGTKIYEETIPLADKMYLSWIKKNYPGDTFFPEFDESQWKIEKKEKYKEFELVVYRK